MATQYVTVEVWVVVDEVGDYSAGHSEEHAAEQYRDNIGGEVGDHGIRHIKLTVRVPLPTPLECEHTVPEPDETAGVVG